MYSAKELATKLQNDGFNISTRTINYYVFEKKMFEISNSGRNVFTDNDYNKLKAILFLKENSNLSLEEIKNEISIKTYDEIVDSKVSTVINTYTNTFTSSESLNPSVANSTNFFRSCTTDTLFANNVCITEPDSVSTVSNCSTTTSYSDNVSNSSNGISLQSYANGIITTAKTPNFEATKSCTIQTLPKKEIKENKSTKLLLSKGIFLEYTENADMEQVKKIVEISKIIF